jgi:hypothetical protein
MGFRSRETPSLSPKGQFNTTRLIKAKPTTMKLFLAVAVPIAALALLMSGCVTEYYAYQGGGPMIGQGVASKRIDGIDIWVIGAPPRRFQIIGYIEDSRPGGPPSMAQRNPALAALAKQQGGDAVLIILTPLSTWVRSQPGTSLLDQL